MAALLNPRQEIFATQVASGKTKSEAYILAGYKENGSNAANLATRPDIAERITEIKQTLAARSQVKAERVLAELARIGFSNVTDAVRIKNGKVQVIDTDKLSPDVQAAIAEISRGRDGLKVKFHDKPRALEQLGRHLGLFKENIDLNVNVSLADLVNGSYKLEHGELQPDDKPAIEHDPTPPKDVE